MGSLGRKVLGVLTVAAALGAAALGAAPPASAHTGHAAAVAVPAVRSLDQTLAGNMRLTGRYSGADVLDLTTGRTLYARNANIGRLPASVEKLFTTTTALHRFGPSATLTTQILGSGQVINGQYTGTLYLRGGGDPTFGTAAFDASHYDAGASVQQLVTSLVATTGLTSFSGKIVADESVFDTDRGTPATNNQPSLDVEGELSGLSFNRGWANGAGTAYDGRPALVAGQQLLRALKLAGVQVAGGTRVATGLTPPGTNLLASVQSPTIAQLIALTNTPSDNYFAETLLKDIGAQFGGAGTTAAGAAVVRSQMTTDFGIHPRLNDGSGLSRYDLTTPAQVVTLLAHMATDPNFTNSLAVAGESGTLQDEMRRTYARGRCRGKTGTLSDVSNLVGYCQARDGHTLAFAFMMNGIYPDYAHPIQNRMAVALSRYGG